MSLLAAVILLSLLGRDSMAAAGGDKSRSGDVFVSLQSGEVQWWRSDGTFVKTLSGVVRGKAEGMAFDAAMNLYVTHHCADPTCLTGNSVERFAPKRTSMGVFGRGYDCNPTANSFDAGEPGRKDRATITIKDAAGNVVLGVSNLLTYGNQQAHR